MQGAAVNNAAVVPAYHAVLLTAAASRCRNGHSVIDAEGTGERNLSVDGKAKAMQCVYLGVLFWTEGELHACIKYRQMT